MSPEFYLITHVVGVLMLFLGIGGMLAAGGEGGARPPVLFTILHGLGLATMLVAGIGRAHSTGIGFPLWVWLKIGCWLGIGLLPILVRRGGMPRGFAVLLALGLGGVAFWLAKFQLA